MSVAAIHAALCVLVAVSAVACIWGQLQERALVVYVAKPLTMLFILAIALQPGVAASPLYRNLVVAALCFSLAGDVFLMLPSDRFVAGLSSFLVAHLLYIAAFASEVEGLALAALLPWLLLALPMYGLLLPKLGSLRIPVAVYVAAIVGMAWQATARAQAHPEAGAQVALAGAALFVLSDSALAWNRFRGAFRASPVVVLGTYFAGQCGIALSVGLDAWWKA